ncbi:CTLH/CRA C-terminal to lish motif domain-containing protein [Coniochaeta sp. 2T2.1]|nr:CTLH/CRA C-terminal to lish motif domain-containing protein [Coniochaeta sp. 2T2.1]
MDLSTSVLETAMDALLNELGSSGQAPRLTSAVDDVQKLIDELVAAREAVAANPATHTTSMTMVGLQNKVKQHFEAVNKDLANVSKALKKLGKAIDKALPPKPLPTEHDTMANHTALINRAIAMHYLREGDFEVAQTFIDETQNNPPLSPTLPSGYHPQIPTGDFDQPMSDADDDVSMSTTSTTQQPSVPPLKSKELQDKFSNMYRILQSLRAHDLMPAINWARDNSEALEARGSNFEFELSKLQYIWLFKGPTINGLPDDERNGLRGALAYARENFARFQERHLTDIQQLASGLVYASNLAASPHGHVFTTDTAFSETASSFTREFCSLLGLSAESPLYIAATAGALALPRLLKYNSAAKAKGTTWNTADELPFETPLPKRMVYHSIFVCPVSKEQTTEANPPMMIPCGHVLARETLKKLCKGTRFKCPYCPQDGVMKDARQIIL